MKTNRKIASEMVQRVIKDGSALSKLAEIITAQGGNSDVINNYSLFNVGKNKIEIKDIEQITNKIKIVNLGMG